MNEGINYLASFLSLRRWNQWRPSYEVLSFQWDIPLTYISCSPQWNFSCMSSRSFISFTKNNAFKKKLNCNFNSLFYTVPAMYSFVHFSCLISLTIWRHTLIGDHVIQGGIEWHGHSLNLSVVMATRTLIRNVVYNYIVIHVWGDVERYYHKRKEMILRLEFM